MYLVLLLSGIVVLWGLCRCPSDRIVGIAPRALPRPLPFVLGVVRSPLVWARLAGIRGSVVGVVALPGGSGAPHGGQAGSQRVQKVNFPPRAPVDLTVQKLGLFAIWGSIARWGGKLTLSLDPARMWTH